MNEKQVLNDLKAIRQIMDRTRQSASGEGGWFSVTGGIMWLVGFLGQQFLPQHLTGWVWLVVNTAGLLVIAWLWVRSTRQGHVSSPVMQAIILSWLALCVFGALFVWLFGLHTAHHIILLALVTSALGVAQMGLLFSCWPLSAIGVAMAAFAVGGFFLVPDYFFLVAALLCGGLLIGNGLWQVRSSRRAEAKNHGS